MKKLVKIMIGIIALVGFYYLNNNWLQVSRYNVALKNLPPSMDGLKVVQISDLHNAKFGENQERLIAEVKLQKPDIIVLTGDLVDRNHYVLDRSLAAVKGFVEMAPTYFVDGNHEISLNKEDEIHSALSELGVTVLNNEATDFTWHNGVISIVGISDPLTGESTEDMLTKALHQVPKNRFTLLLAHRSEFVADYAKYGIDVVYTGHAHGGQVRVPGVGGLIDHQGHLFPDYLEGVVKTGETQQIISRGLGNSLFPARVFNRPEIVVSILKSKP
ncbi:MAG: metallophosphoesterase [Kurthia sp.]|nr:metallophosphoesterase [Candidatus Kurthia equi]